MKRYRDTPVVGLNSNASLLAVDIFGPNGLISRRSGSSSVFYTFDERGNTVERLDGSGAVLNAITSDDYGLSNASGQSLFELPRDSQLIVIEQHGQCGSLIGLTAGGNPLYSGGRLRVEGKGVSRLVRGNP